MAEKLRFNGQIKSVVFSRGNTGHWYAVFNMEVDLPEHKYSRSSVGIDLGVKTLATLSDGKRYENQAPLRPELKRLKHLNRELSRRQRGSGRWKRTKSRLAKLHRRIANRRLDYLHKMTTEIARTYKVIGIEDLNVSGMLKNHYLALSISDASFREIRRQLAYKAEWYGGTLVTVDRFFPSSKLCHSCGHINDKLTLADRTWTCSYCGAKLDRDENAALNIERQALKMLGRSGFADQLKNGRGADVRLARAICDETSKVARRPAKSRQFGVAW